jgi:putative heme iron utilization protein
MDAMREGGNTVTSEPEAAANEVRRLIRQNDRAVLATQLQNGGGGGAEEDGPWPYGSLVLTACDHDGAPLLLLSDLAEHTKNIQCDSRVSLLFENTQGLADPLTGPRATVLGRAAVTDSDHHRLRYLNRHPSAAQYAGFADFKLYRVEVERAHLVAGFGRISWAGGGAITPAGLRVEALMDAEADIVGHMNADHADALQIIVSQLLRLNGEGWLMTGIDPEGFDLRLGGRTARLDFDHPIEDAPSARTALVSLTKKARNTGLSGGQ